MSNLEVLLRRVVEDGQSTGMGSQRAREFVIERLEGKAVRGEKAPTANIELEEQLEKVEADLINSLTQKDDANAVPERKDGDRSSDEHSG